MSKKQNNTLLVVSIIVSALLISGALIFAGLRFGLTNEDLQVEIAEGIENYVKKQQESYKKEQEDATKPWEVDGDYSDTDPYLGEIDAPITIVEFADYECPACQYFHTTIFPELKEKYIDTGKVKFVYRDLPLTSIHDNAYPAALFAECVFEQGGNEAYFNVHDTIFEEGFDPENISKYANELGLNENELKDCFDSEKFKDEIMKDIADSEKAGFTGKRKATPAFIVNGNAFKGAVSLEVFESFFE